MGFSGIPEPECEICRFVRSLRPLLTASKDHMKSENDLPQAPTGREAGKEGEKVERRLETLQPIPWAICLIWKFFHGPKQHLRFGPLPRVLLSVRFEVWAPSSYVVSSKHIIINFKCGPSIWALTCFFLGGPYQGPTGLIEDIDLGLISS